MKRMNELQTAPDERQKKPKTSPVTDQGRQETPMSDTLGQVTVGSSNTGRNSSPARPKIVVHKASDESHGSTKKTPESATTYEFLNKAKESPSSRPGSPKPPDAPRRPQSLVEESFIPASIAYSLRFIFEFEGCPDSKLEEENSVLLQNPESYQEIERVAEKHAKIRSAQSIGSKELHFFYGTCTMVSDNRTKFRLPLRSPEDWTEVNKRIVGYWNLHTHERLHLRISRHYLASQEQPTKDTSFAKVKSLEISDLMKQTWEEKDYIPHNVLKIVISDQTIDWIIKEKPPESLPENDLDAFIRRVQAEGRILLAMCVYAGLEMECLKELLDNGCKDSSLPLDKSSRCHVNCRLSFRTLVEKQGGFQAAYFTEGEDRKLPSHTVVPLQFYPREHSKDDLDREVTKDYDTKPLNSDSRGLAACRSGGHSHVYCVKLNPNHHNLSADLDACFALKDFNLDIKQEQKENFERELAMLRELRKYAHPHIVTHLATWTRDGRYYMLFPYAQCDLREYMSQNKFAEKNAFWLLEQFHGMAEAVKRIHNLSFPEIPSSSLTATTPASGERRTAWHHDIKPENILFFKDNSSSCGMFRFSDWGSAKVNVYRTRSYNTKNPIGTLTYEPPEQIYNGQTSRPYDLWSLGCVFLELLVWAVFGWESAEQFSDQRNGKWDADSGTGSMMDDAFWQKVGNEYVLRPAVVTQLQSLDETLIEPGALPFKRLVGCIRRMLETQTHERIRALDLCDLLDRISIEVKATKEDSKAVPQVSLIPADHTSPDAMASRVSPSGRSSTPAYAERIDLSPSTCRHVQVDTAATVQPAI